MQTLCVAEAGELAGACRRCEGEACRDGTLLELEDEVADMLIVTGVFAERAGIDVDAAVTRESAVIYPRDWREVRDE